MKKEYDFSKGTRGPVLKVPPGKTRVTIRRDEDEQEERWITIRMDSRGHILLVVYTWRDENLRLISARPATPRECRQYEEGL